jgi:para-aminobenzoate synthetase / 4-amino-4-deoxychorismate lyase
MNMASKIGVEEVVLVESILWESCCGYWLLPEHLERLKNSANYYSIQIDDKELDQKLARIVKDLDASPQLIQVSVNHQGTLNLSAKPTIEDRTPYKVTLASECINKNDQILFHNTTDRQQYDKAKSAHPDFDDVILWNSDNEITESCTGNIVVEIDDVHFTPPLECGLLAGTYRAELLKQGTIQEKIIKTEQLENYTKIFIINSAVGWREAILNEEKSS